MGGNKKFDKLSLSGMLLRLQKAERYAKNMNDDISFYDVVIGLGQIRFSLDIGNTRMARRFIMETREILLENCGQSELITNLLK